jgi:hypothetical protein
MMHLDACANAAVEALKRLAVAAERIADALERANEPCVEVAAERRKCTAFLPISGARCGFDEGHAGEHWYP